MVVLMNMLYKLMHWVQNFIKSVVAIRRSLCEDV